MAAKIVDDPALRERRYVFKDRLHAGELLAAKLRKYAEGKDVCLLAIPAGGVPVGYIMARELNLPLDLVIVRKIQIPWNTEAGFGALSWDGTVILNQPLVRRLGLSRETIDRSISLTQENIYERSRRFRGNRVFPEIEERTVVLVDDGLASGFTMLAAVRSIRKYDPKGIIVAVPTASSNAVELVAREVNELLCLNIRSGTVFAVADAYEQWHDISDREVFECLDKRPY